MSTFAKHLLPRWAELLVALLLAFEPVAHGQENIAQDAYPQDAYPQNAVTQGAAQPPSSAPSARQSQLLFTQPELDQMLAPIALYPDQLLSQILMAATYPLEVVEASRWSKANTGFSGDAAVRAIQQRDWDPSVKSLVAFPRILQMMDENLEWTERVGDAFLVQEAQVMDTIQGLRQKAYAAGNLKSNDQVRVDTQGQTIVVQPANPEVVYVPYYDPAYVYGAWWWPAYPPFFWPPWPGYYVQSGFGWGAGIIVTTGFFFGDWDWRHHRANVVNVNNYYFRGRGQGGSNIVGGVANSVPVIWRHDPDHRRGVPYRNESVRREFGRGESGRGGASPEFRERSRGAEQPSREDRRGGPLLMPGTGALQPRSDEQFHPQILPPADSQRRPDFQRAPELQRPPESPRRMESQRGREFQRGEDSHRSPETQPRPDMQPHPQAAPRLETRPGAEVQPRTGAGEDSSRRGFERRSAPRESMPGTVAPLPQSMPRTISPSTSPDSGRGQEGRSFRPRGEPGSERGSDNFPGGGGDDRHSR